VGWANVSTRLKQGWADVPARKKKGLGWAGLMFQPAGEGKKPS